jgi:hypothetical protein
MRAEQLTRFAAEWNEIHVLGGTSIPWHVGVRKHSHFIDSLSPISLAKLEYMGRYRDEL